MCLMLSFENAIKFGTEIDGWENNHMSGIKTSVET